MELLIKIIVYGSGGLFLIGLALVVFMYITTPDHRRARDRLRSFYTRQQELNLDKATIDQALVLLEAVYGYEITYCTATPESAITIALKVVDEQTTYVMFTVKCTKPTIEFDINGVDIDGHAAFFNGELEIEEIGNFLDNRLWLKPSQQ